MKPKAFTLTELLVVVGILLLIAGIILSVLTVARGRSQVVVCASNERQMAMALLMYAQDNDGYFPTQNAIDTRAAFPTFVPTCPLVTIPSDETRGIAGYCFNGLLIGDFPVSPVGSLSLIKSPTMTVLVTEQAPGISVEGFFPFESNPKHTPKDYVPGWNRHNGGSNLAFADGHVKWYDPRVLRYGAKEDPGVPHFDWRY